MIDIPTGWLALIGSIITAVGSAVAFMIAGKNADITARDKRIEDLQARVDSMQERQLTALLAQLDQARERRAVDDRLAATLEQSATALAPKAAP